MKISIIPRTCLLLLTIFSSASARGNAEEKRGRRKKSSGSNSKKGKKKGKQSNDSVSKDVCIIGGGPSGTYAAFLLEEKGYDVVLFEKEDVIGGKTVPPFDGISHVDRHILIREGMPLASKLMDEYAIPVFPRKTNVNYVASSGFLIPESAQPPPSEEVLDAIGTWVTTTLTTTEVGVESASVGHANDFIAELQQPTIDWMAEYDVLPLVPLFYTFLTNFGYDFLNDLPALYTVTSLGVSIFLAALERNWVLAPYERLFQAIALSLDDVRLNSNVSKVHLENDDDHIEISVQGDYPMLCENVIIAFPQSSETMAIVDNLDLATKALFDEVKVVYYYEVIVEDLPVETIPVGAYYRLFDSTTSADMSIPNIYLRSDSNGKVVVLLNSGAIRRTEEEVFILIRDHVKFVFGGDLGSMELFAEHLYLPHVGTESLESGFYQKLNAVQGQQGVYYLGGLIDFELVEECLQSTVAIIEAHF